MLPCHRINIDQLFCKTPLLASTYWPPVVNRLLLFCGHCAGVICVHVSAEARLAVAHKINDSVSDRVIMNISSWNCAVCSLTDPLDRPGPGDARQISSQARA